MIPKTTAKLGCAALRLVHGLDTFGKAYYKQLWRRRLNPATAPDWSFGYQAGRRRESQILMRNLSRWLAYKYGFGYSATNSDASNAFASNKHERLDIAVDKEVCGDYPDDAQRTDAALIKMRYHGAWISLHVDGKCLDLRPATGVLPGDAIAGELFNSDAHEVYVKWS